MLGEASKDFHNHVSHLVAGEVGSKKYAVAAQCGKAIMTPDWVDAVWDSARFTYVYDKIRMLSLSQSVTEVIKTLQFKNHYQYKHTQPFNGRLSGTTRVSRYQKGKTPIWILLKQEMVSGSGISWAICKSAPRSRQIITM